MDLSGEIYDAAELALPDYASVVFVGFAVISGVWYMISECGCGILKPV